MAGGVSGWLSRLRELPTPKKILVVGLAGTAAAGLFFLAASLQRPSYVLLYSGLGAGDAASVVAELKKEGVPYDVSADGGGILVPADRVYEVRMNLAAKGLPAGGVGFEIFDKVNIGTTEFVQKVNYRRALQGELARTISQLDAVQACRVHLSLPEKSVFVEDQKEPAASVFLKLRPGAVLRPAQVRGIAYLISGAVEGLSAENVTVMDTGGRVLSGPRSQGGEGGLSGGQIEIQQAVERSLEKKVQSMLERVVGPGKVIARVRADLDFQQVQRTEEVYDPNVTAVRSEQTTKEKSSGSSGLPAGVPGVASNVPGAGPARTAAGATNTYQKQNEVINYEINKVTRRIVEPAGAVKRISASVLVDGTYKTDEKTGEKTYQPRSAEEMAKLETVIKGALGFDPDRGDQLHVENVPFEGGEDAWVEDKGSGGILSPVAVVFLRYGVVALFGLLFVLFFLRPLMQWVTRGGGSGAGYPATVGELETALKGKMLSGMAERTQEQLRSEIQKLIQENPSLATTLVRDWLHERR